MAVADTLLYLAGHKMPCESQSASHLKYKLDNLTSMISKGDIVDGRI